MKRPFSGEIHFKITLFLLLIIPLSPPVKAGEYSLSALQELRMAALRVSQDSLLLHGEWSFLVMDVATGEILVSINPEKSLAPASNLKLFTSAAALALLGPEHRFETKLGISGRVENGTLHGNVVIVGGGDPTLGSTRVPGTPDLNGVLQRWLRAVSEAGIRRIAGNLLADISLFDAMEVPDGWLWMDIGNYYGAGASALCINENQYRLVFRPGAAPGQPTTVLATEPPVPGIHFLNFMLTGPAGSGDNGYIYGGPGNYRRLLHGTIPAGVAQFAIKGSLPAPARFALQALRDSLAASGITVQGKLSVSYQPVNIDRVLLSLSSPPLRDIVYWLNKKSINLYAEVLLKQLGKARFGEGSYEKGIEAIKDYLQSFRISLRGLYLFDGSGLSPLNAITTLQMAQLLRGVAQEPYFEDFYRSLPIAGVKDDSEHLSRLCRGTKASGNLRAKTGLIERVRAHSGYVRTASGRLVCFSMIANDHSGKSRQIDRLHERLMIRMAQLK